MSMVARVRSNWAAFIRADEEKSNRRQISVHRQFSWRRVGGGCLCLALGFGSSSLSPRLQAQTATGSVAGTVRDPSGAAVSGATVRLTNIGTNETRTTQSNDLGYYTFPLTLPAAYKFEVDAPGFKRFFQQNVKLDVGLATTVNANLAIGPSTEVVTVTAQGATVESSTASLGQVIGNQTITNLPLNGRNSYSFAQLVPGVRASQGFGQVAYGMYNDQFVSINGSRPNQSSFS